MVESGGYGLLSFRGQSTLFNNVTVDGADDNQAFFSEERGRTNIGYSTPKAAILEFQVTASNSTSEYGRAVGGIVNAVTKSGSNTFHGEAYDLDRDSALAAENPYLAQAVQSTPGGPFVNQVFKPTDIRKQYGFAVGGPIIHNKLFFFFAADRFYHYFPYVGVAITPSAFFVTPSASLPAGYSCPGTGGNTITSTSDPNFTADSGACTLQANLGLGTYSAAAAKYTSGLASVGALLGQAPRNVSQTLFLPKIDWMINNKNHVSFVANRLRYISPGGQQTNATANVARQSVGTPGARVTWGVAKLDTFINSNMSNEVRYQYGRDFEFASIEQPTTYEQNTLLNTPSGYSNPTGVPPSVDLSNGFDFGVTYFLPRKAFPDERRWQVADTVQMTIGNHSLKFGGDYIHTYDLSLNLQYEYGSYNYATQGTVTGLTSYLTDYYLSQNPATASQADHYTGYVQGFGPLGLDFTTSDYSGFVQDEWRVRPRLTLTAGLRYEYEQTPPAQLPNPAIPQTESLPSDKNNFGPRIGFAYDLFGTGKTVLRGGYGVFYSRLINSTIFNAGGQSITPSLSPGQAGSPIFPEIMTSTGQNQTAPAAIYFDKHFQLPQVDEADLTLERDLGWNTVASISWLGSYGRELPGFVDQNLPTPTTVSYTVVNNGLSGPLPNGSVVASSFYGYASSPTPGAAPAVVNYGRPNPHYSSTTDIFSEISSNYNAMVAQIKHRMSSNLEFELSYTWSHGLDDGATNTTFTTTNSMLDPTSLRPDYGNDMQNVPSRIIFTSVMHSPWEFHGWKKYVLNDFELSPSFAAQTGEPYSATLSGAPLNLANSSSPTGYVTGIGDSYNGSDGAIRVPNTQRDSYHLPADANLDARISKRFRIDEKYNLEFLLEGFNLFNHQNVTAVNMTAYALGTTKNPATGATENTLTLNTVNNTSLFATPSNSNNNNIYAPRQLQVGVRMQF